MRLCHVIYLILLILSTLCVKAQNSNYVDKELRRIYHSFWENDDYDFDVKKEIGSLFKNITDKDIALLSDSSRYIYHYLLASFYEGETESKFRYDHLKEAIELRETSIGVLDPEYMELLWAIGNQIEDSNIDRAIYYYQKALVIGHTILYDKNIEMVTPFAVNTYGMIMGDLANLYEKKGWTDRYVFMQEMAFMFRTQNFEKGDEGAYVNMLYLFDYYIKNNDKDNAIKALQKVLDYLEGCGNLNSDNYTKLSWTLASTFLLNHQHKDALGIYKKVMEQIECCGDVNNAMYEDSFSRACSILRLSETFDEQLIFMEMKKHSLMEKQKDETSIYATICNAIAVLQMNNGKLDDALENMNVVEKIYRSLYGNQSEKYALALHNKGRIFMLQGNKELALKCLHQSKKIQLDTKEIINPNTEKYIKELEEK